MKKIIFTILIVQFSLIIANAQWENISGIIGGANISSVVLNNNDLLAGSHILTDNINMNIGVFRSTNYGNNWLQTSLGESIKALFSRNSRIFAVTDYQGSFYSDNNGSNWILINIPSLFNFCSNDTYLFASTTNYGLYSSSDNGLNWQSTSLSSSGSNLLTKGSYVFSGRGSTFSISSNNGVNWTQTSAGFLISSLATNGNEIFAGSQNNGIYKSTNNGLNWSQTTMSSNYINALLAIGTAIIAGDGMGNGIYVSTNLGTNWVQRNEGFGPSTHVNDLLYANNYIFAGNANGIWRRNFQQLVSVKNLTNLVPEKFSLYQNYPNPFNATTKIKFLIPSYLSFQRKLESSNVTLKVFDITGREIQTLVSDKLNPGTYEVTFDGSNFASGVYFYQLRAGDFTDTKKLILLK